MYSAYNEGKSVVAERFIRTLKNNIFKHLTVISKNVYFDVLDDIVNKYNNTVHSEVTDNYYAKDPSIKLRSMELHSVELRSNKKNPKFKVGDNARISNYKNIFAKGYTPNWSEEVFVINKIKNTVPAISDLNDKKITGSFYQKELQKASQKEFRIEKVLKIKKKNVCQMESV